MNKKILYVVNDIDFFISHRLKIAIKMKNLGYKVFIAGNKNSAKNNILLKDFGIHHLSLNRSSFNLFLNLNTLFNLYKIVRQIRPNLIHLITLKPIIYGRILSFLIKFDKIVCSITGLGNVFSYEKKFIKKLKKIIITFFLNILFYKSKIFFIVQNERDYDFVYKFIKQKSYIYRIGGSGVDINLYKPTKDKEQRAGTKENRGHMQTRTYKE